MIRDFSSFEFVETRFVKSCARQDRNRSVVDDNNRVGTLSDAAQNQVPQMELVTLQGAPGPVKMWIHCSGQKSRRSDYK